MAALNAADANDRHGGDLAITLVSSTAYLTIRPRLYERAPETLRTPLAPTLEPAGIDLVEAKARSIDTASRIVEVEDRRGQRSSLAYDRLILATGSELKRPSVPGFAEHAFDIDSYDGAVSFDRHLQHVATHTDLPGSTTFVIVGSGMTGVELAAEMRSRIAVHAGEETAKAARVVLVEQASVLAPEFGAEPRPVIERALAQAGVETRASSTVVRVEPDAVTFGSGERLACATTVLATGMRANALTAQVPGRRDELGRLHVDDELRVAGVDHVYATGDVARALADDGQFALMSCQHSLTMGKYAGYNAAHDLLGLELRRYRQPAYTNTLDLGGFGAVCTKGWQRQLDHYGADAKKRKRWINEELIYPAVGSREDSACERPHQSGDGALRCGLTSPSGSKLLLTNGPVLSGQRHFPRSCDCRRAPPAPDHERDQGQQ
jgi:NADH dehydrogenase